MDRTMDTKIFDELKRAWALKRDAGTLTVIKDYLMERVPDGVDAQKWLHQQLGEINFRWKSLTDLKATLVRYERDNASLNIDEWRLARATRDVLSPHDGFVRLQKGEVTIIRVVKDPSMKYAEDGTRLTDCCGSYSTITDDEALCCKACFKGVPSGQGDGSEAWTTHYLAFQLYRSQTVADPSLFEFIDGEIAEDASRVWEGKVPRVELKKFTANQRLSEETLAFAAEVYVDGKKAGTVSNHGTGGSNDVHWLDRETGKRVEAWLRSQIHVSNLDESGQLIDERALEVPDAYEMNEDLFFGILAEDETKKKEEKRIAAKRAKFAATARARGSAPFVARLSDRSELFFEMRGDAKQSAREWLTSWAAKQKRRVAVLSVEEIP